jgi:hypothetical protein
VSTFADKLRDRTTRPPWGRRAAARGPVGLPPRELSPSVDLEPRRQELRARVAELQWDLGGLVYEMAIRDHIRVDVLVQRAAALQAVDAELAEVERVLRMADGGAAGACGSCGAMHSRGAGYCWQCGQPLIAQVPSQAIAGRGR